MAGEDLMASSTITFSFFMSGDDDEGEESVP